MSNPNLSYSNLDARYAKPEDVDTKIAAQAVTDAGQYLKSGMKAVTLPSGLGWDSTILPGLSISRPYKKGGSGSVNITPEAAFDLYSSARSAPGVIYYVSTTGSDSAAGTSGAPFATMAKATTSANTAGVAAKVFVMAGTYPRTAGPCYTAIPTVDMAWVAQGGRVITGAFDNFTATQDATYTNCYSYAITNVCRVMDMFNLDQDGNYGELTQLTSSASICNSTPNSWILTGGTVYINRKDGIAPNYANTRMFRSSSNVFSMPTDAHTSIYIGGLTSTDGFDCEGGATSTLKATTTSAATTRRAIVLSNSSFKYPGGNGNGSTAVGVDSYPGLVYASNCRADCGMTDGFNLHNTLSSSRTYGLFVNCSGFNNGRVPNNSCNGLTSHEDVVMIDVCGYYRSNHGGSVASVGASKSFLAGTLIKDDLGDLTFASGNGLPPTAIYVRDTAEYWCDGVQIDMPASTRAFMTTTSTAKIHLQDCDSGRAASGGLGTVDQY